MASFNADEMKVIDDMLAELGAGWEGVAKRGLFEGAAVMKDGLLNEVLQLPALSDRYYFGKMIPMPALREEEKQGLIDGLRIYKMEKESNGVSVSIGFEGYNRRNKANTMIARALVKGTSLNKSDKFVQRAFKTNKQKRIKAISDKIYSIKIQNK